VTSLTGNWQVNELRAMEQSCDIASVVTAPRRQAGCCGEETTLVTSVPVA